MFSSYVIPLDGWWHALPAPCAYALVHGLRPQQRPPLLLLQRDHCVYLQPETRRPLNASAHGSVLPGQLVGNGS